MRDIGQAKETKTKGSRRCAHSTGHNGGRVGKHNPQIEPLIY